MSMTNCTPGPWFVVNDGTDDEPMMSVKAARIAGQKPRHVVAICCTGDSPQPMENANAALIAAAPDMYAALRQIYTGAAEAHDGLTYSEIAEIAHAALAKAEGKR